MTETVTFTLIHCLVKRGPTTINVRVPEHEIKVLEAIHGHANVFRQEEDYPDEITLDASADYEIGRLATKYNRKGDDMPVTARAFPMGAEALERFGFKLGRKRFEEAPASSQVDHAKEARKAKAQGQKGKAKE